MEKFLKFKDDIFTIFDTYAEDYRGEKCLSMPRMLQLQNPDVKQHVDRLNWVINDLQFESPLGSNVVTYDDLERLVAQYEDFLRAHFKDRDQKKSVKKLIDNLQEFNRETEQPLELLKDVFMYLIQKQKHKKYSTDDWFLLVTAIHQFLVNLESESTKDSIRLEKKESIDVNAAFFENELNFYKDRNRLLQQEVEDS